LLCLSY